MKQILLLLLFIVMSGYSRSEPGKPILDTVITELAHKKPYLISTTIIPYENDDIISPGRGAEQWHNSSGRISNPNENQPLNIENSLDVYYRLQWGNIEGAIEGSYDWGNFDGLIKEAVNKGQKFSFGIMTCNSDRGIFSYDGAQSSYPLYLHNKMQAEGPAGKDWISGRVWVPNWNSPNYIDRLRALHEAIKNHLLTTYYIPNTGPNRGKKVLMADVIYCIDIRGYGNWGEWHSSGICNWSSYPAGRQPTAASLKKIIDVHTQIFDQWPLVMMIAAYDGGVTTIPFFFPFPEVSYYALTARNKWGDVGFRRDQWGATDKYLKTLLEGNNTTYNGSEPFSNIIMKKWKTSPVTGEAYPGRLDMADLLNQVNLYHPTSFGNGNYGSYPESQIVRDRIREAFKRAGYRLIISGGEIITMKKSIRITVDWQNAGVAPTYENWNVVFELKNSNDQIEFSGISGFKLKLFLPDTSASPFTDVFPVTGLSGDYTLNVKLTDPEGYREPLPLAITGRNADGSYTLLKGISF